MHDFDFDVIEKNRVAASARKRKNGSKSRKCSLPHDNMTEAQWKKMNGDVKSWNLDEPMSYEHFKEMAPGMKKEYIQRLHSRFNAGVNTVGVDLFGLSKTTLAVHLLKTHGIRMGFSKGTKMTADERAAWERWLGREQDSADSVDDVKPEPASTHPVDIEETLQGETEAPIFCMDNLCVEWCGTFDAVAFVEQLRKLPFPDGMVKIRLEVKREEAE